MNSIYLAMKDITVRRCSWGAFVYLDSLMSITNTVWEDNTASELPYYFINDETNGGAIAVAGSFLLIKEGNSFINNYAAYNGGAIALLSDYEYHYTVGGIVWLTSNDSVTFSGNRGFQGNNMYAEPVSSFLVSF